MVTVAVVVIVITVGVPSFRTLTQNNRLTAEVNDFVTALNLARSEAIKRNRPASLCKGSTGAACVTGTSGWEQGWIVFVNNDNDSPAAVDSGEEIVRVFPALDGDNTLRGNANVVNYLTYRPSGSSNTNGTFTLCDDRGDSHARAVIIGPTGRPRISTTKADGSALECPGG